MIEQIVEKMRTLRLSNMARSFSERHGRGEFRQMSADEAICLLVDDEWAARQNKRLATAILKANFKPEGACLENLRYQADRGFARADIAPFRGMEWIRTGANVLSCSAPPVLESPISRKPSAWPAGWVIRCRS